MSSDKRLMVSIGLISVGENQTRLDMDAEGLTELASSIQRVGMISPIVVCKKDDKLVVVAGHRRLAAAQKINMLSVPVIIRDIEMSEIKEIAIAENLFRMDLTPLEQAASIKDVIDSGALTIEQVSDGMHRSENWVQSQLDLLCWPDDVLQSIHTGFLSVSAASNLALITDDTYRDFLLKNARENGATARTTAAWLQAWRSMAPPAVAVEAQPLPASENPLPAVPQSPCIVCSQLQRTDGLAMVLVCPPCITAIRGVNS